MGAPDDAPLTAAVDAAWSGLLVAHRRLTATLDAELLAAHGLSLAEYDVLYQLSLAPGDRRRMAELADALLLSRSGATRLVDRLEARGLVQRTRTTADGRGLHACLTPAGVELLRAARATHRAGIRRHFAEALSAEQLDALAAAWTALSAPR
jgi:DNA-binding MarR family transcriptional regulator